MIYAELFFPELIQCRHSTFSLFMHLAELLLRLPCLKRSCGGGFALEIAGGETGEGREFLTVGGKGFGNIYAASESRGVLTQSHIGQTGKVFFVPDPAGFIKTDQTIDLSHTGITRVGIPGFLIESVEQIVVEKLLSETFVAGNTFDDVVDEKEGHNHTETA